MPEQDAHPVSRSRPESDPAAPQVPAPRHDAIVSERGAFAVARCSCGWRGPARRARDRARRDADEHRQG